MPIYLFCPINFNPISFFQIVNKQLADKERVAAALENSSLLDVVNQCLTPKG